MKEYKAISIGIEFYKDMIDKEYYYIDMEKKCFEALNQIEEKHYDAG